MSNPNWGNVRLLVVDCDGVLTDNTVYLDDFEHEQLRFNRADGIGLWNLGMLGIGTLILTQEQNDIIERRAKMLHVAYAVGGRAKLEKLRHWIADLATFDLMPPVPSITLPEVCYIGNERNDIPVLQTVGFPVVPADSLVFPQRAYITKAKGGWGCVREVCDLIEAAVGNPGGVQPKPPIEQPELIHTDSGWQPR